MKQGVSVYSPLSYQCKDDLTSLLKHLKMWASVINPSYTLVSFFCKFMVLTKERDFQDLKKRRSPCLPEAQCACFVKQACQLLYKNLPFFNSFVVFFCRAFPARNTHIGVQRRPTTFLPEPEWGFYIFFGPPQPGTTDFRCLHDVTIQ